MTSTSHTDAASSYAVKQAYDRGSSALTAANNAASSVTELAGTVDDLEADLSSVQTNVNALKNRVEGSSASRSADLAANTNFTVGSYTVGSKTLNVYLNGLRCQRGIDFNEVGNSGAKSTNAQASVRTACWRSVRKAWPGADTTRSARRCGWNKRPGVRRGISGRRKREEIRCES